jgi:hypothetical protein
MPRDVRLLALRDVFIPTEQLNGFFKLSPLASARPRPSRHLGAITAAALSLYGAPDADPERIADQCPLIGALRTDPGRFHEPTIYAVIGVLQHCDLGTSQGRSWFDNDFIDEVDRKFEQHAAANIGPTTCAHFAGLESDFCKSCPHWSKITSPIQLGRPERETPKAQEPTQERPTQELIVPGFENHPDGLYFVTENKKGEAAFTKITDKPIGLETIAFRESLPNSHAMVVTYGKRPITFMCRDFFGAGAGAAYADNLIVVREPDLLRDYMKSQITGWQNMHQIETMYERFGWKGDYDAFLWGNRLYTNGEVTLHRVAPALEDRASLLAPHQRGSLERWSNAASQLFGQGMEAQAFGLVASFAGPLLKLMEAEEGGTILSLVNPNTGTGKTTLLKGIASVWGQYKGLNIFDDDTRVAKSLKLGFLGNLPAVYDELATRDPEIIRQFVLAFTNGQDRARGAQNGVGLVATASEWQTLLCIASNKPLTEILTAPGQPAATAFRMLELTVKLTDKANREHGEILAQTMADNAGWAADRYLRYITRPAVLTEIRNSLRHYSRQVYDKAQLGAEHRFWRRLVAATAVAAVITKQLEILDFSPQYLINWICEQMLNKKSSLHKATQSTALETLVEFLNTHNKNELIVQHEYKPRIGSIGPIQTPREELLIRRELNSGTCYITMSLLHTYLSKQNIHRSEFLAELRQLGVLQAESKFVTLGANTILAKGQSKCYEFDLGHPSVTGFPRMTVITGGKDASAQS